jgi:hydroxymethylglutaryl-CoA synthase
MNRSETTIGIDRLSFYTPRYVLGMDKLAAARGHSQDKFTRDLGQESMAVMPPNEDIVTMGVNAAAPLVDETNAHKIKLVLFATESAIDQAKAAGIYVQYYLGLAQDCRVVELKQACYSTTAALQFARAMIAMEGEDAQALIIGSDIAKYEQESVAEPTQGAGAAAMLITESPRLLALENEAGVHTEHIMDFWRPPYSAHAFVSAQYSVRFYLQAMEKAWASFAAKSGLGRDDIHRACYHTPFVRMAENVHGKFRGDHERAATEIAPATVYGRQIGNTYTAALFIALASLLENAEEDLTGQRIGLFAYGSGAVAEYFTGRVQAGYRDVLLTDRHKALLTDMSPCDIDAYNYFYNYCFPEDGGTHDVPEYRASRLHIARVSEHKRIYEWNRQHHTTQTSQQQRGEQEATKPRTRIQARAASLF